MAQRNVLKTEVGAGLTQCPCPSELKARQAKKISEIRDALVAAGFDALDQQAAVLGLSRSTTWAVLNRHHKGSGLSAKTVRRILLSPNLPPTVRGIVEEYLQEKLRGAFGHGTAQLRLFRGQLSIQTAPAQPARGT
jgi:hypothetical protein